MDNKNKTLAEEQESPINVIGTAFTNTFLWLWSALFGLVAIGLFLSGKDAFIASILMMGVATIINPEFIKYIYAEAAKHGKRPPATSVLVILATVLLFTSVGLLVNNRPHTPDSPDTSKAQAYRIVKQERFPAPSGKTRLKLVILSDQAQSAAERAQTVIKAALDVQQQTKAHEILVWLDHPSIPERLAIADYYPYDQTAWGKDKPYTWRVESSGYQDTGVKPKSTDIMTQSYLKQ